VGFAPDERGRPVFTFSGMSSHTQDILADPRCSITIASKEFKGAADGRVNLMGKVKLVTSEERDAVKAVYLAKHPGAFCKNRFSCPSLACDLLPSSHTSFLRSFDTDN
jgi:putative heme iron utilization protein